MTEVQSITGLDRVFSCMCVPDNDPDADDAERRQSFPDLFALHHALEEMISAAARDGALVDPARLAGELMAKAAQSGISPAQLQDAIANAAMRAGVGIRTRG